MLKNPKAKASMRKEWLGLHEQGVFDFSVIREYHDVKTRSAHSEAGRALCKGPWHHCGKELPVANE